MTTRTRKPPILPMKRGQNYSLEEFEHYVANYEDFIRHLQLYFNTLDYSPIDGLICRNRSRRVTFFVCFGKSVGTDKEHYITCNGVINGVIQKEDEYFITNIHIDHNIDLTPTIGA